MRRVIISKNGMVELQLDQRGDIFIVTAARDAAKIGKAAGRVIEFHMRKEGLRNSGFAIEEIG